MQTIQYDPEVSDDGKDIRCSVEAGEITQSDTIAVFISKARRKLSHVNSKIYFNR